MVATLTLAMLGIADAYVAQASSAAPASTPCSGWNKQYFHGRREYNCSFDRTAPVRNKYNKKVGTLQAGTSWVICQAKGSTFRLGTSYYNYWWAFTVADNGRVGWVNAVYGSGGENYGRFSRVPVCRSSTKFIPPIIGRTVATTSSHGAAILRAALSQQGVPYVYGGGDQYGPTNGGFDCSGLVVYAVYRATGKVLYHQAAYQWQNSASEGAVRVSHAALKPGDIVFFPASGTPGAPGHVGIYYGTVNGDPTVVDAYDSGTLIGLHSVSQEGGLISGALRF